MEKNVILEKSDKEQSNINNDNPKVDSESKEAECHIEKEVNSISPSEHASDNEKTIENDKENVAESVQEVCINKDETKSSMEVSGSLAKKRKKKNKRRNAKKESIVNTHHSSVLKGLQIAACYVCNYTFYSTLKAINHFKGRPHQNRLQMMEIVAQRTKAATQATKTVAKQKGDLAASQTTKSMAKRNDDQQYYCEVCRKFLNSAQQFSLHLESNRHQKKAKQEKPNNSQLPENEQVDSSQVKDSKGNGSKDDGNQVNGDHDNGNQVNGEHDNSNHGNGDHDNGNQVNVNCDNGNHGKGDGDHDNGNIGNGDHEVGHKGTGDRKNGKKASGSQKNGNLVNCNHGNKQINGQKNNGNQINGDRKGSNKINNTRVNGILEITKQKIEDEKNNQRKHQKFSDTETRQQKNKRTVPNEMDFHRYNEWLMCQSSFVPQGRGMAIKQNRRNQNNIGWHGNIENCQPNFSYGPQYFNGAPLPGRGRGAGFYPTHAYHHFREDKQREALPSQMGYAYSNFGNSQGYCM